MTDPIKFSDIAPTRTAGQLPSSRTKQALFDDIMQSDDIERVKTGLLHTWLHYQALELALHDQAGHMAVKEKVLAAIEQGAYVDDRDDLFRLASDMFAGAVLDAAYDLAHTAGAVIAAPFIDLTRTDTTEAFKMVAFGHLDFEDPTTITDEDLAKFFQTGDDTKGA